MLSTSVFGDSSTLFECGVANLPPTGISLAFIMQGSFALKKQLAHVNNIGCQKAPDYVIICICKASLNKDFRFTAGWKRQMMYSDTQAVLSKTVDHYIIKGFEMSALPFATFTMEHMAQSVLEACSSLGVDPSFHPSQTSKKRPLPVTGEEDEDEDSEQLEGLHSAAPSQVAAVAAEGAAQLPGDGSPRQKQGPPPKKGSLPRSRNLPHTQDRLRSHLCLQAMAVLGQTLRSHPTELDFSLASMATRARPCGFEYFSK